MANENAVARTQQNDEKEKGAIVYQVAGQDVKLSYQIVRNFLTKGAGQVTDQDLTQFISICKYNQLNPFLNEAYLVKFGTQPAQMIVSKEALLKRAEACETYEGIQAGVIVIRDNQAVELEGCFYLPTDKLVGGWAKVYRSDRKFPYISKVQLEEYDKKQSTWNEKKSTMIRKVAEVQALREAFPTQLGAMYTAEEQNVQIEDAHATIVASEIKENANKTVINIDENKSKSPEPKIGEDGGMFSGTLNDAKQGRQSAPGF
jgi:phage recombination protein Bet